ncbi:MAG: hypothetical protein LBL38_01140 [Lactobacillales bacterium]|jgi:hypothetical protein|nr:hypothetical protein [Lactobacillales bacterium]
MSSKDNICGLISAIIFFSLTIKFVSIDIPSFGKKIPVANATSASIVRFVLPLKQKKPTSNYRLAEREKCIETSRLISRLKICNNIESGYDIFRQVKNLGGKFMQTKKISLTEERMAELDNFIEENWKTHDGRKMSELQREMDKFISQNHLSAFDIVSLMRKYIIPTNTERADNNKIVDVDKNVLEKLDAFIEAHWETRDGRKMSNLERKVDEFVEKNLSLLSSDELLELTKKYIRQLSYQDRRELGLNDDIYIY